MTRRKSKRQPGKAGATRVRAAPLSRILLLVALALAAMTGYFVYSFLVGKPQPTNTNTVRGPAIGSNPNDLTPEQREEAIRHYREIVRTDPDQPEGHLNLGNTLAAQGEFEAAIPHYRKAIELRPDYAKAHNNLAVALKETGNLDEAYRHIHEAMRLKRGTETAVSEPTASLDRGTADTALPALTTRQLESRQTSEADLLDPQRDGWESEVVAEEARAGLERLIALLKMPDRIDAALLDASLFEDIAFDDISTNGLRPKELAEVFRDASVVVRRQKPRDSERQRPLLQGRSGLVQALAHLATPLQGASDVDVHVKVVGVNLVDSAVEITARFDASGRTDSGAVEQHATWQCRWQRRDGVRLRLKSIRCEDYEEIEARGPRWFADRTFAVLGANPSFGRQLVPGLNHWLPRIGRVNNLHVFARSGIAVGDVNGDGLDDVYICQPGGLPNRLSVQDADGTCRDTSKQAGVDWLDHTSSALLVDLDSDGDQDLVAATVLGLIVMENDSSGRFERRAVLPPTDIDLHSLSASDYDSDGDLDLYICVDFSNQAATRTRAATAFVYHDANDGGANVLFRNDIPSGRETADWTFSDVTKQVGLDADNRRHSLAAAWEDYDNDGDPDLYVANDYGQNCLYRNDGGRFVNVASEAGVVDFGSGMSVSWGDSNRDGWMDLYVGNMFSSAGNRITRQGRFQSAAREQTRALYRRFAKGNSLFENRGDGTFHEVGDELAVEMGRWAWSSIFADVNNDGWEDLLVANGYITTEDTGDL